MHVARNVKARRPGLFGENFRVLCEAARGLAAIPSAGTTALLVGAQKAGTTSLYHYLVSQPRVYGSLRKEPYFFSSERYLLGAAWYRRQFAATSRLHHDSILVDASTTYLADRFAAERAGHDLAGATAIVCLRDPAERAVSHYLHNKRLGIEPLAFGPALEAEAARITPAADFRIAHEPFRSPAAHHYGYVHNGAVWVHAPRWEEALGRVLYVHNTSLATDPTAVVGAILGRLRAPGQVETRRRRDSGTLGRSYNTASTPSPVDEAAPVGREQDPAALLPIARAAVDNAAYEAFVESRSAMTVPGVDP